MKRKSLIILEGPDGGGKSTFAKGMRDMGYQTTHFGPLPGLRDISRIYAEAMLPALLGYTDLVFDRSWISERCYGPLFRGEDRVGAINQRHLKRISLRCSVETLVFLPPWENVCQTFESRRKDEMLSDTGTLRKVYDYYASLDNVPGARMVDYTSTPTHEIPLPGRFGNSDLIPRGSWCGNPDAKVLLVGDTCGNRKPQDGFYQWPFSSFSPAGCSHWLTDHIMREGIYEEQLMWVNSDDPHLDEVLEWHNQALGAKVVALGDEAASRLDPNKNIASLHRVPHPAYWKRFRNDELYPLGQLIKELT